MAHAVDLSECLLKLDAGPRKGRTKKDNTRDRSDKRSGNPANSTPSSSNDQRQSELPLCLWRPHHDRGIRHLLKDCRDCPPEQKRVLLKARAEQREKKDPPARNTRSQTRQQDQPPEESKSTTTPTTGRLAPIHSSPQCDLTLIDKNASFSCQGRCDDGSDDSIISPRIAENAVLKGIGKISAMKPIRIKVALKQGDDAASFSFSRSFSIPRLILHLSAGKLALVNVSFLICDDNLSGEDLLIGRPLLEHLEIDSRTLLEQNRSRLDETDCSPVRHVSNNSPSMIGRLLLARIQRVQGFKQKPDLNPQRPKENYYNLRRDDDPFPDDSLIDPADINQTSEIDAGIATMIQDAVRHGFAHNRVDDLASVVNIATCSENPSLQPPAKVPPLRIHLREGAKPVIVKLRKCSPIQHQFLHSIMSKLEKLGYVYRNLTSRWACAPHLVPKDGPDCWRFNGNLRPVNFWTIPKGFPIPVVEHELEKARDAQCFASFDLTHGYWQFLVHEDDQETQSLITPDGIFTPRCLLHGNVNANSHLLASLTHHMPTDLKNKLLLWVDDMVIPATDIDSLINDIASLLQLCSSLNLKLHPTKCRLYRKTIIWCGREQSADGIRYDPPQI